MNWAAYHLANIKKPQGAGQARRLLYAEVGRKIEWLVSGKVTYLWGRQECAVQLTSVVLVMYFLMDWFKDTFLGEAET